MRRSRSCSRSTATSSTASPMRCSRPRLSTPPPPTPQPVFRCAPPSSKPPSPRTRRELLRGAPAPRRHSAAGRRPPSGLRQRERLAQLRAADGGRPPRESGPRRLLDLHLHQLAAHVGLGASVARALPRSGPRRRGRPHAGVLVRARPGQRQQGGEGDARRVSGRARPRLRSLERLRQPVLAGRLSRGCRGPDPLPPLRRGRLRRGRAGDSDAAAGGGSRRRARRARLR